MTALLAALLFCAAADPTVAAPPAPPAVAEAATPPTPPTPPAAAEAVVASVAPVPPIVAEAPTPPVPPAPAAPATDRARWLKGEWPASSPRISLDLERVKTREAIKRVAEAAKWSVTFKDSPHGRVDVVFTDAPADEALLSILKDEDLQAVRHGSRLTISDAPDEDSSDDAQGLSFKVDLDAGDRTQLGGSVTVSEGETVRAAVAVGGDVDVNGTVLQDAVAVGGNVRLGPKAVVKGDAVSVGGTITADPSAKVGRSRVAVGLGGFSKEMLRSRAHDDSSDSRPSWIVGILKNVAQYALFFVFGLMLLAIVPERVRSVGRELRRTPALCGVIGLVGLVALVPILVLLAITIVGLILIPFVGIAASLALLMGFTALALEIGARVPPQHGKRTQVMVLGLGVVALFVVSHIPVLGWLVMALGTLVALGAVLRTKFGNTHVDANFIPEP